MWSGIREGLLEQMTSERRPEEIRVSWEDVKATPSPQGVTQRSAVCSRKGRKGREVRRRD